MQVFVTKMEGYSLYVTSVCNHCDVLKCGEIFCLIRNVEEDEKLCNLSKAKRHTLVRSRKLWENLIYGAQFEFSGAYRN